ncbi:hypothetical protein TRFO_33223 [Tritrichomonas foetus]|uniref:Uncharacterized protein n=1 Tax=Tritrichomonas foetus TaxID=1144522 RepID=A0A1J4JN82_9EUKA|nr:hypothetical protein TRFO_33223 [Tritrichomonas foetus]|eukprot:OHT00154.1 hypothetical protein TRFO_33223 [Tritrichomonas foetus]
MSIEYKFNLVCWHDISVLIINSEEANYFYNTGQICIDPMSFKCFVQISLPPSPTKFESYWLKIDGLWFSLSKKFDKQPQFLFPLQIQSLESAEKETQKLNSLFLETSEFSGNHKIYITSTNRLEIIQIYQALQNAQKRFNLDMADHNQKREPNFDIEYEVSSGFMNMNKQKSVMHVTPQSITFPDNKLVSMRDVVSISAKQNDNNCQHKLHITLREEGGDGMKEFTIPEKAKLEKLITYVLFTISCK